MNLEQWLEKLRSAGIISRVAREEKYFDPIYGPPLPPRAGWRERIKAPPRMAKPRGPGLPKLPYATQSEQTHNKPSAPGAYGRRPGGWTGNVDPYEYFKGAPGRPEPSGDPLPKRAEAWYDRWGNRPQEPLKARLEKREEIVDKKGKPVYQGYAETIRYPRITEPTSNVIGTAFSDRSVAEVMEQFAPGQKRIFEGITTPQELYEAMISGRVLVLSKAQENIAEWLSENFRSTRSYTTGLETTDLAELYRSPWGPVFQKVLENREARLEYDYLTSSQKINDLTNKINDLTQAMKDGEYNPSDYKYRKILYQQRSELRAKRNLANSSLRSNDNLFLKLRNDEVSSGITKRLRGESLIEHGNPETGSAGLPVNLAQRIRAAQNYYAYKGSSHPQQVERAIDALRASGLNETKMPSNLEDFLRGVAIRAARPGAFRHMPGREGAISQTIEELIQLTGKSNDRAVSERLLEAGRQRTMDFYRLYGLGALPLGAEKTMGQAILASTGRMAGSLVNITDFTTEGLWERGLDDVWRLTPHPDSKYRTPANMAIRYRPQGFGENIYGNIGFSIESQIPVRRTMHAFNAAADREMLEDLAKKSRLSGETPSIYDDKLLPVLSDINARLSGTITRNVARQVRTLRSAGRLGRGYREGGEAYRLLIPEGNITPARVVEELVAGMLYGGKHTVPRVRDPKAGWIVDTTRPNYLSSMRQVLAGEDEFSRSAREILRGMVPNLPSVGDAKLKDYQDALTDWAATAGLPHNISGRSARMAIIRRAQKESAALERAARASTLRTDLPAGYTPEGNPITLGDRILVEGEQIGIEPTPYGFESAEGGLLRQEALRVFRGGALKNNINEDFRSDVEELVKGITKEQEALINRRKATILNRAGSLRASLTPEGVESFNLRVNRLRRIYPELDNAIGQPELVRMATDEIKAEARQLNQELSRVADVSDSDIRAIAENVHRRMLESAELERHAIGVPPLQRSIKRMQKQIGARPALWGQGSNRFLKPGLGQRAEMFKQYLGGRDVLGEAYDMVNYRHMESVVDYVENAYSGNPFVGRSADIIYNNLVHNIGAKLQIDIPGYEESYRHLFDEESPGFRMRLRDVNVIGLPTEQPSLENTARIRRIRAVFESIAEDTEEERTKNLAAYLLPDLMRGWANDPTKRHLLSETGGVTPAGKAEVLARARETIRKSPGGIFSIPQEMEFQSIAPDITHDETLRNMVRQFVTQNVRGRTIFGQRIRKDKETGELLLDEAIERHTGKITKRIQEEYSRTSQFGGFRPIRNTEAMDEIERLSRVHFLQEMALAGPNMVTSRRHQENMAILQQAYRRYTPFNLPGSARTVSQALGSSVLNPNYNPIVGEQRLGADIFDVPRQLLDEELRQQGLSMQMVEQVSRAIGPQAINLRDLSTHESEMVRRIMGIGDGEDYLNNPLARGNNLRNIVDENGRFVTGGEQALQGASTLEIHFAQLAVNSRLEAGDIIQLARIQGYNLEHMEGMTRDEVAQELYDLSGIDLRVSTPQRVVADFLTQRTKAFLDPSMNAIYSEGQLTAMNRIRAQHGIGSAEDFAEEIPEAAEDFSRPLTRLNWNELNRAWKESKIFRGGAIAAAGLTAMGLIHSVRHRDRTPEDMQGPAYLPGGNPYQYDQYGIPNQAPPPTQNSMRYNDNSGVEYTVRARGKFDSGTFRQNAATMLGTNNVYGSSYNVQGDSLGKDNTGEIASQYGSS